MPTKSKEKPLPGEDDWQVGYLQVVAFPTNPAVDIKQDWFYELTGEEPQEQIKKSHERVDRGAYKDTSFNVTADMLRVTLTISPKLDPETVPAKIPSLGSFSAAIA